MNKKTQKALDFQKYLKEELRDPAFRKHYEEYGIQLEIASIFQRKLKIEFV